MQTYKYKEGFEIHKITNPSGFFVAMGETHITEEYTFDVYVPATDTFISCDHETYEDALKSAMNLLPNVKFTRRDENDK